MALRRGANHGNTECDDVQSSIELLDRVLSEFDDVENANQVQNIQQVSGTTAIVSSPPLHLPPTLSGSSIVGISTPPGTNGALSSTPDDESPSLGHQSEDDGYMSMNGRRAKFNLAFKPLTEHQEGNAAVVTVLPSPLLPSPPPPPIAQHHLAGAAIVRVGNPDDFPPPPEEAQRLIATLLPKVSPAHSSKRNGNKSRSGGGFPLSQIPPPLQQQLPQQQQHRVETIPPPQKFQNSTSPPCAGNGDTIDGCYYAPVINGLLPDPKHSATQTTLPKTRHQRPFGWEHNDGHVLHDAQQPLPPPHGYRFGSLPFQHSAYPPIISPTRVPPRTVAGAGLERHREVRRRTSEDNLSSDLEDALRPLSELADDDDAEHFSDDSLEEALLPPPPPPIVPNKRASIAWEVSLDDDLYTPGSTKVVGRRRRKSGSQSSTSSIPNRMKEFDEWPDPPPCTTEDEITSPFSDNEDIILPPELNAANLSGSGTYIIRRNRNEKKLIHQLSGSVNSSSSLNSRLSSDLSIPRYSDFNQRISRELNTPSSRYSVDLSTPHSRLSQELNSPKSRFSLDLNNSRHLSQELSDLSNSSRCSTPAGKGEFKKHSTTFDNIKSLIKEGVIEHYNGPQIESTAELNAMTQPIVRVVSLPSLSVEELTPRRELTVTVEEEEDAESPSTSTSEEISPLRKIEKNISELLERRDFELGNIIAKVNGVSERSSERRVKRQAPAKPSHAKTPHDLQKSSSHSEIQRSEDYYRQLLIENSPTNHYRHRVNTQGIQKSESAKEMLISHRERDRNITPSASGDFPVRVEVLQHEFPPLPPSPVEEDEDEYSEIMAAQIMGSGNKNSNSSLGTNNTKSSSNATKPSPTPPHSIPTSSSTTSIATPPPPPPPHSHNSAGSGGSHSHSSSLKTRSMDAGYCRGRRSSGNSASGNSCHGYGGGRNSSERRTTLPNASDHQQERERYRQEGPQRRGGRSYGSKRDSSVGSSGGGEGMQTSCSLPETPIFARGCDIPRTPHRRAAPDVPSGNATAPRQSSTMSSINTIGNLSTGGTSTGGGIRRGISSNSGLEQAMAGAEVLRLAGGPGRGWYPKQRHTRRPASIEHLDRLAPGQNPWDATTAGRKPLTLPPNLTPKFFQRSPKDALRRVTSLLIRKGNNPKETKKEKEIVVSPTIHENTTTGEEIQKRKGFFKNFWKRSRHYSLEQQQ